MTKFKQKSVIIDAVQWTGNNFNEIQEFLGNSNGLHNVTYNGLTKRENDLLGIPIFTGFGTASLNDWIIKGIEEKCYICNSNIFEQIYEKIGPETSMSKSL